MSDTTLHLGLPFLAAAQAQKHVTVNAALSRVDAVTQLCVLDRTLTAPPAAPAEGDRHLVAAGATGAWAGRDGQIAAFTDGAWEFFTPEEGWLVWVVAENALLVLSGGAWKTPVTGTIGNLDALGIGTDPDATNRFAAKLNNALWTARGTGEGGSGDLRTVLNKEAAGNVLTLIFQSGWAGRAELGLAGDDNFSLKVCDDAWAWREALRVDRLTAEVRTPVGLATPALNGGPLGGLRNLLINGGFTINQRGFAGGVLTEGAYGFDRWKAGAGGCTLSVSDGVVTLTGAVAQIIEAPDLAGQTVTLSVEDPDADLAVSVGGASGTISAGSGRRGVTLTVPSGETGNIAVRITVAAETSFRRAQLEIGPLATPFERRPIGLELGLCRRYFQRFGGGDPDENIVLGCVTATTLWRGALAFDPPLRVAPSATINGGFTLLGAPSPSGLSFAQATPRGVEIQAAISGGSVGGSALLRAAGSLASSLDFSAEL